MKNKSPNNSQTIMLSHLVPGNVEASLAFRATCNHQLGECSRLSVFTAVSIYRWRMLSKRSVPPISSPDYPLNGKGSLGDNIVFLDSNTFLHANSCRENQVTDRSPHANYCLINSQHQRASISIARE